MSKRELPVPDLYYEVSAVGGDCPLEVGERVCFASAWEVDFLAGGHVVSFDVKRADGTVITLRRGESGAVLRPLVIA